MAKFKDITSQSFGRLSAKKVFGKDKHGITIWECECECGNLVNVRLVSLVSGSTKSCGCLNQETRKNSLLSNKRAKTHGLSKHPLYSTWAEMKQRCTNPNRPKYPLYGGRGIKVCEEWMNSFPIFLQDMGERPKGTTLNRINNDGDYCKENCKWQSHSEQNKNRRKNIKNSREMTEQAVNASLRN